MLKGCSLCIHLKLFDFTILFLLFQQFKLSPEQLSTLIECKLSGNMSYTKEMWKLFFSRFSANLGDALQMLSNTVKTHSQSAVSKQYTLACECMHLCECVCVSVWVCAHACMYARRHARVHILRLTVCMLIVRRIYSSQTTFMHSSLIY